MLSRQWAWVLCASLLFLGAVGCKSAPPKEPTTTGSETGEATEPDWVTKPFGIMTEADGTKVIQAVGIASYDPNPRASATYAKAAGRDELGRQLRVQVQNMVSQYMASAQDFYDPATRSSIQNSEDVSRQITDEALMGSHQVDSWTHPKTGDKYILMKLPLDGFIDAYRNRVQQAMIREEFFQNSAEKKAAAMGSLDQQIGNLKQNGF